MWESFVGLFEEILRDCPDNVETRQEKAKEVQEWAEQFVDEIQLHPRHWSACSEFAR